MVVLISKNTLQTGKGQDFLRTAEKMAEETQKEEGCRFYKLAKDTEAENIYYFIEAYENDAALEAHRNSAHFRKYVPLLGEMRTKPSELTKCEVIEF